MLMVGKLQKDYLTLNTMDKNFSLLSALDLATQPGLFVTHPCIAFGHYIKKEDRIIYHCGNGLELKLSKTALRLKRFKKDWYLVDKLEF